MSNQVEHDRLANSEKSNAASRLSQTGEREWGTRLFLGLLFGIACAYAMILIYHVSRPVGSVAEDDGILEQCRQVCLRYGLVSTGNVRRDAEAYLDVVQKENLTEGLSQILSQTAFRPAQTQAHPLLNQIAPEFALPNDAGKTESLSTLGNNRPVLVVFYLGYGCSHCVAQLIALENDLHYFRELDADVVAISSDEPGHTTARFQEYGRFHFSVLADVNKTVAQAWNVYQPESSDEPEFNQHGTFVVDRFGRVVWAEMGAEPFLDNKSLLHIIARTQGLLPSEQAPELPTSR